MTNLVTRIREFLRGDSGQMLPVVAIMLIMMLAMTGFVIDIGRSLTARRDLQATTDAAALAGGSVLPSSNAVSVATRYSSVSGNLNVKNSLPGVTMVSGYPKILCLNTLTSQGMACASPANGNAIQVKQQMTLQMTLLKLIGINSITLGAEATASMTGASREPYNVAIIVDTTGSMNYTDSDSNCNSTRLSCALAGVQVLLQNLSPCASNLTTCGTATNGNVAAPVDRVALYTFPGLSSSAQAAYEYDCSTGTTPTLSPYNEPSNFQIGQAPVNPPQYQVIPFSSDYRTSNSTTTLNPSSNLVKAVNGVSGCTGLAAVGGYGTYYAGVVYRAGYDLYYQQQANPGTQNVIVILSDGDASASSRALPNASTSSGTLASTVQQCQQAVTLAQEAYQYFGMRVYTIAYGAAASGCSTDSSGITPCQTMRNMASQPQYFYSDYTATGGASDCVSASHPTTNLNQIFQQIANDLSASRLIPDNTT